MTSTSETGHAKNVANFQDLTAFVTSYGTTYSPSKASLKLNALNTLITTAQTNLTDVISKNTSYNNAVNERIIAFNPLKVLSTRLISALGVTDAPPQKLQDAKAFNRKIQGKKATNTQTAASPNTPAPKTISTSQQSYDQIIQHFAGLIAALQSEKSYTPNEPDLKITALIAKQAELTAKNNAVATAYTAISNSRIARDKTLYNTSTSLVDTATEVKKYIKSIFGASSPEFAQVKGIEFRKIKK